VTPTAPPTATATKTPTPTYTPPPVPAGWTGYTVGNFFLALPAAWETIDIDEEGIQALLDILETINSEWAQGFINTYSSETLAKFLKFWAMDPNPVGIGYANIVVVHQTMPIAVQIDDFCAQLADTYAQLGVELLDSRCDLKINGVDAAQITARVSSGLHKVRQSQYIYLKGKKVWTLAGSVDETRWAEYQPIFEMIGESFQVVE
jgi:hypothetical protein